MTPKYATTRLVIITDKGAEVKVMKRRLRKNKKEAKK